MQSRLQRKHEKDSLKQAGKYIVFTFVALFLVVRFGLPSLIRLAAFIGDIKSSSQPIEKSDTLAPGAPTLLPLPEATNSAKIAVAGYAESGATIKLNRGGISIEETISDNDGNFSFKNVVLKDGANEFFAEAVDDQGNSSEPSRSYIVVYDSDAPILTIDEPEAGKRFFDKDSPITISGKAEPDSQLIINSKFVFVDSGGNFSTPWPLSEGDNQLDFATRDSAGNETKKTISVNYTP
ncbi:hypothetical protein KKH13_00695 [Patescibacteria group bacterium]|nr:hypothetical protein [Patescibacteria group bacterium]